MSKFRSCIAFLVAINKDALLFLVMRLASIILAITAIILLCRASTIQPYFYSNGLGQVYDMMPLGPLAFSLAWAVVSLILPGCHRKYHPALDMGLDLLACGVLLSTGGVLFNWALNIYAAESCREIDPIECQGLANHLATTEKTAAILIMSIGLSHLVMFFRACRAIHMRRKQYVPSRNSFMRLEKSKDTEWIRSRLPSSQEPSHPATDDSHHEETQLERSRGS